MAAAREERHRLFRAACKKLGVSKLLVGHQADDQTETFLLRCSRGSGIPGLAGMKLQSPLQPDSLAFHYDGAREQEVSNEQEAEQASTSGTSHSEASVATAARPNPDPEAARPDEDSATATALLAPPKAKAAAGVAQSVTVIRPLLEVSRAALRQLLVRENLPWRDDPTNADRSYSRNAIRHMMTTTPGSGGAASGIAADVLRMQRRCAEVHTRLDQSVQNLLSACMLPRQQYLQCSDREHDSCSDSTSVIDTTLFSSSAVPVALRALATILQAASGATAPPKTSAVNRLLQQLRGGRMTRGYSGAHCVITPISGCRGTKALVASQKHRSIRKSKQVHVNVPRTAHLSSILSAND